MLPIQLENNTASQLLDEAMLVTARRKFEGDLQTTQNALKQGECDVCRFLSGILVTRIGDYLSSLDKTIKVIFKYEPEHVNIRRLASGSIHSTARAGINLVARVERKSAALLTLVATLEKTLSEARRQLGCRNATPECFILDIQLVDEEDIQENRGLAMMVNSMYVRSMPVWRRAEAKLDSKIAAVGARDQTNDLLALHDTDLIPEAVLFEQAQAIMDLPHPEQRYYQHHLSEIKVALIRRLISDQLAYINIAKKWFSIQDLHGIFQRRFGFGKIGGKAAGMTLAGRILQENGHGELKRLVKVPDSYFIGADTSYIFMAMNGLMHWNDEKYKPEEQIWQDYAQICSEFEQGEFPPEITGSLETLLLHTGSTPLIVRSSSQLEDNFGTSFAGKYESYFCPNQGSLQENLAFLKKSIARIYASTLRPEALLYRKNKGLQDYDERMAILIQPVQGARFGRYYFPFGSGVAFSRNLYRWAPQIKREDGFARLVWGLGTRAVQRVGDDFPRLIALSHPTLQPDDSTEAIRRYSQQFVDVLDMEENQMRTLPVKQVIHPTYCELRLMAQKEEDGYFSTIRSRVRDGEIGQLVITYNEMLRRTKFADTLSNLLKLLEKQYQIAVDIEFTCQVLDPLSQQPEVEISLLQCRPQSYMGAGLPVCLPENLEEETTVFTTGFMVPHGYLRNIRYVLYIPADFYYALDNASDRNLLSRAISRLNQALPAKGYICVGPGRWGTTNHDLGVYVAYTDINNAAALVELSGSGIGIPPEPSLGTHFFQDLMEAQIYPLAVNLDEDEVVFNRTFFEQTPNSIYEWIEIDPRLQDCVKLIDVEQFSRGHHIEIIMDDEVGKAAAFFALDG